MKPGVEFRNAPEFPDRVQGSVDVPRRGPAHGDEGVEAAHGGRGELHVRGLSNAVQCVQGVPSQTQPDTGGDDSSAVSTLLNHEDLSDASLQYAMGPVTHHRG